MLPPISLLVLVMPLAGADASPMTLQRALEHARTRSLQVMAANTAVKAEQASVAGATPLFGQNPSVEAGTGLVVQPATPRIGPTPLVSPFPQRWRDTRLGPGGWVQGVVPIEIAGQRWRRVGAVEARVEARVADAAEAARQAMLNAGMAFLAALHAAKTLELAEEAASLAANTVETARQRLESGAGTALEVRLAELDANASVDARNLAHAQSQQAKARLAALLSMPPDALVTLGGPLVPDAPLPSLEQALSCVPNRTDVRVLDADRRAALAEARLASAGAFPTPKVKASYQYWNSEQSVMAWLEVPLPVFERGQGEEARARAKANGLADQARATAVNARAEVESAYAVAKELERARQTPRADGRVLLKELEVHFAAREVDVMTLVAVRHQILLADRAALDAALQEGLTRLWLGFAMGALGE